MPRQKIRWDYNIWLLGFENQDCELNLLRPEPTLPIQPTNPSMVCLQHKIVYLMARHILLSTILSLYDLLIIIHSCENSV